MNNYERTFKTWNKIAKLYEAKFMDLELYNASYDTFCEQVTKKNASVLEIGCGPGNITKYLLTKRPDFDLLATDVAPMMIELAQVNCPTAKFEVIDARQIDRLVQKFDAIVCGFCLPYLAETDLEKLFVDCKNLLIENGNIYLSFVEGEKEQSGFLSGSSGDSVYFYYHSLEFVLSKLELNNFEQPLVIKVAFTRSDQRCEEHTIVIATLRKL